jgi:hypothetical protein
MSNECRYHAVGSEVFYKGDKKVKCFGDESERMAKDIADKLNYDLETLEMFEPKKGVK